MKNLCNSIMVIVLVIFTSCGSGTKEKAEKAKRDSIARIDSLNMVKEKLAVKMDIKDAFDKGKIELTIEALDNGKMLKITVLNLTTNLLFLSIAEGTTSFSENVAIINTKLKKLEIPANEKTTFNIDQKPGGMIGGSMTLRKQPK